MRVVEIRSRRELDSMRERWNALLHTSGSDSIFLTWEWIAAWWSAYAGPSALRVLAAYDGDGTLRGLAPLQEQKHRRYGQTVSTLSFVGDGSNDSDYLDFIVSSGYEAAVLDAYRAHLASDLERGTVLTLNEVPETSPTIEILKMWTDSGDFLRKDAEVSCGTVQLPGGWEDYLKILKPRFRTKIRSVLRNLESRPEVRFRFCETHHQVQRMLPVLYDLHTRRWAQDSMPGVFGWNQKREFYSALSTLLLEKDWLRLSWVEWNGRVLACQYGFAYQNTYFHLQEGFEPASEHVNIGLGLRAWSIRRFLEEGIREYDFLGGFGRHKADWGARVKKSKQIQIAKATYKNIVFCHGSEWESATRESIKKIVPKPILQARQARLERHRRSAVPSLAMPAHHSIADRFRQGLAECYFRLQVPKLARKVRDQYWLSVLPNGTLPKIEWGRRNEPCGRILYYHRVNDDGDPFFPAISTDLFEREIRFISRHYEVVSLPTLVRALDEAAETKNMVAITFDDGYRDNFQNAFPILKRYRVPATIFLATGGMDSGEPLWFELLALTIKKTPAEFLDLEIDIPRRFWLRTQEERLVANGNIFALLRTLPDSERRDRLTEILHQLELHDFSDRKEKMLTWDQVRTMHANGIDFGGHTVTHPFISKLTPEQGLWEVSECKRRIEEELQSAVRHFAYPNGREEDFSDWNQEMLGMAGYEAALTTLWGMNYRSTNRMQLRRGGPWEENAAMFAYKLDWYQLVNG